MRPRTRWWRRLLPHRPHQQVTALIVLFFLVGGGFALSVEPRLGDARARTAEVERVRPVLVKYAQWERAEIELLSATLAHADASTTERAEYLSNSSATWLEVQSKWNEYRELMLESSVERRLLRSYQESMDVVNDVALRSLTNPSDLTDDQIAKLEASVSEVRSRMDDIRAYYSSMLASASKAAVANARATQQWHQLGTLTAIVSLFLLAIVVLRSLVRRDREDLARTEQTNLEARLQRALENVSSEELTYPLIAKALAHATGPNPAELLVADSSRAHFHQVVQVGPDPEWAGCPVASPTECPAAKRGQTHVFASSEDLDACPQLAGRPYAPCSAVCVPVSIAGKTVGVVHSTGRDGRAVDGRVVASIETIARKSGERLGMLRAFSRSQAQAHTDALTGLLNRRSIEDRVYELDKNGSRYCVAYADLDHFKMLNDVHGHDVGDRALRLFARVVRDSVRPNDIPGRYGGEEFVIVLPDCDTRDAFTVSERLRQRLAEALKGATVPPFTVSIGLSGYDPSISFGEAVERADCALLLAKRAGRNRTVVAGDEIPEDVASVEEAAST